MIIIEGMDNTGKTTLVNRISKLCKIPIYERVRPMSSGELMLQVLDSLTHPMIIMDRHPAISELVYGKPIRGVTVEEERLWRVIGILRKIHPLFIYCRPAAHDIFNFGDRLQMDGVISKSQILLRRYDLIMNTICESMPEDRFKVYNWRSETTDQELRMMIQSYVHAVHNSEIELSQLAVKLRG